MSALQILTAVAQHIEEATGNPIEIDACRTQSGGCINDAFIVTTTNGAEYFVKSNHDSPAEIFQAEADGLDAMRTTGSIRVPEVISMGSDESGESFLILEAIRSDGRSSNFFETFGRQLAEMHRMGTSNQFGFETDNWLGATTQPNSWTRDWNQFWVQSRLQHQLKLARDNGTRNDKLHRLGQRLIDRIDNIFGDVHAPPALIHGDLWSGNYLCDESGHPVLIDPACYFANREAEFGMTKLFGGFPASFYHAYHEAWPLVEGWETRVEIYTLYHLLNHLNLFGNSYLNGCLEILERYA